MLKNAAEVRTECRIGIHAVAGDVPGFSWRITPASRSWVLRTMLSGKRCELGMGGANETYEDALAAAAAARRLVKRGVDPRMLSALAEGARREWDWRDYRPRDSSAPFSVTLLLMYARLARRIEERDAEELHQRIEPALGRYPMRLLAPEDVAACLARIEPLAAAARLGGLLAQAWSHLETVVDLPPSTAFFAQVWKLQSGFRDRLRDDRTMSAQREGLPASRRQATQRPALHCASEQLPRASDTPS